MKNFKKGFIWLVILMVVIIILAVWGVLYYMGQNSSFLSNNFIKDFFPQENQIVNNTQQDCLPTTTPWIKVLSPNGGEVYSSGRQISVKWESCNIDSMVGVTLSGFPYPNDVQFFPGKWVSSALGSEIITIPINAPAGNYTINISTPPAGSTPIEKSAEDFSDNFFTINSNNNLRKLGETCGEGIGSCGIGLECFYPCGIPGCQYVCAKEGTLPRP